MGTRSVAIGLLAVIVMAVAGCGRSRPATTTPIVAPTIAVATLTAEAVEPTPTAEPTQPPSPSPTVPEPTATPDPYAGWLTYTNAKYGFSFRYPSTWTLTESASDGRVSDMVKLSQQTVGLVVGFRATGEDLIIEMGMPAGDIQAEGTVQFLGLQVPRQVLVYQGKDKAVYYNGTTAVTVGNLLISPSLHDFRQDYGAISIAQATQDEVDKIVASFALIQ